MSLNSISQFYDVDSDEVKDGSDSDDSADSGTAEVIKEIVEEIKDTLDVIEDTPGVIKDGGNDCESSPQPSKSTDKIVQDKDENAVEICEGEKEPVLTDSVPSPEKSPPKLETYIAQSLHNSDVEGEITKEESSIKDAVEGEPPSTNENEDVQMDMSELWPFTHCKIILCRGPFDDKEESSQGWNWEGKYFVYCDRILSISESDDLGKQLDLKLAEIGPQSLLEPSPVPEVKLEHVSETVQSDESTEIVPNERKQPPKRGRPKGQKNKPKKKEADKDIKDEPKAKINDQIEVSPEPLPSSSSSPGKAPQLGTPSKPVTSNKPMKKPPSPLPISNEEERDSRPATSKKRRKKSPVPPPISNEEETDSQPVTSKKRRKKSPPPPPISNKEETDSPARLTRSSRRRQFQTPPSETKSETIPNGEIKTVVGIKTETQEVAPPANYKGPANEDNLPIPGLDDDIQVEVVYKCPFCLIIYDEPDQLILHLAVHNSPARVEQDSSPENGKRKFQNPSLKLEDKSEEKKMRHSQSHQESKISPRSNKNTLPSKTPKTEFKEETKRQLKYDQDNPIKYPDSTPEGGIISPRAKSSKTRKTSNGPAQVSKKVEKKPILKVEKETQPNCQFKLGKGFSEKSVPNGYIVGNRTPKDEHKTKCAYCRNSFELPTALWKHLVEVHPGKLKNKKEVATNTNSR